MYITVRLLSGYQEPLTYKIPDSWELSPIAGTIVSVPLRTKIVPAVVTAIHDCLPETTRTFAIKDAHSIEPFPRDGRYVAFAKQIAHYYQIDEHFFTRRIRQFLKQKEQPETITKHDEKKESTKKIVLTDEQQAVVDFVMPSIITSEYNPTLVHGVTGSGKTEIYKRLIITAISEQKTVILLLPEVTLALQFERILRKQLPSSITIRNFHSATSIKEKRKSWQLLVQGTPHVLIGVHLPVLLPISNLGLIIVDEEHEVGYQEKRHPTINSKEIAVWRAKAYNIPIILGSATPSISSLYNVSTRGWALFQLTKRYAGSFPTIETVSLVNKEKRQSFWITNALETAIADRIAKKEQTIIFLNRRGYSFFMQCKKCGYIPTCTTCSVSLTVHDNNYLSCHYCGTAIAQPTQCPSCKADEKNLLKKGIGTQQVVSILEKLFPQARIARADLDTSSNKKVWQQTLHDFESGAIDILVGTQTITKGYHFPRVTLVGILWADLNLHFPIYNASETTLQQLIQVAGRAGREHESSTVIVQYMADHDIFAFLDERQYVNFYANELATRIAAGYPPHNRLVEIALKHSDEQIIERDSVELAAMIRVNLENHKTIQLLGPSKPPVHTIKNIHTRKLYLKGPNIQEILAIITASRSKEFSSSLFVTPNPLH